MTPTTHSNGHLLCIYSCVFFFSLFSANSLHQLYHLFSLSCCDVRSPAQSECTQFVSFPSDNAVYDCTQVGRNTYYCKICSPSIKQTSIARSIVTERKESEGETSDEGEERKGCMGVDEYRKHNTVYTETSLDLYPTVACR